MSHYADMSTLRAHFGYEPSHTEIYNVYTMVTQTPHHVRTAATNYMNFLLSEYPDLTRADFEKSTTDSAVACLAGEDFNRIS